MQKERQIIFYKDYFISFYLTQKESTKKKIEYVLSVVKKVSKIPAKFLKHIEGTNGLYEIRIEHEGNIYRIFCCFDEGNIVILFNAFQKKTSKTPRKSIDLALKLMKEYHNKNKSKS